MIDDYELADGKLKVTFTLLAATDAAQVGKSLKETFTLDGKGVSKIWDLIEAARLVAKGNRKQALDFDEAHLKGRQVALKIHLEQGQTKNDSTGEYKTDPTKPFYARLGFGAISDIRDPKNAALPKDHQFLAVWPELPGQQVAGQQSSTAGLTAPIQPANPVQHPIPAQTQSGAGTGVEMNW